MAFSPEPQGRSEVGTEHGPAADERWTTTGGHRPPGGLAAWGVALCYLGCFVAGQGAYLLLGASARASFLAFASTSVANLARDPVGCLAASAFVTGGDPWGTLTWLPLIAAALCGAVRAAGAWRAAGVAAAGHVFGTLVSEGIVAWRVHAGVLADGSRNLTDVGPSYVVVAALTLTLLLAPWRWRLTAAAGMLVLIFPGQIFSGLTSLSVAAVGHAIAVITALLSAALIGIRSRRPRAAQVAAMPPTARPIR